MLFSEVVKRLDKATCQLSELYMNRHNYYDDEYYHINHLRKIQSRLGFLVKLYYRYVASYAIVGAASIPRGARILDIGCGIGILVEQLRRLGFDAVGVDVNLPAIRNSLVPAFCSHMQTTAQLPYADGHFDLVVSREVLEHIADEEIDECIQEWDRVSKGKAVHIIAVTERGPSATQDPTHINVQSEAWWINKFIQHGYIGTKSPRENFLSPFGSSGYFLFQRSH